MNELNQNDISTIVSIVPIEVNEFKPGIYPGNFNIPACENQDKPIVFHIGESNHVVSIANTKNPLIVPTSSFRMARAIVEDYMGAQVGTDSVSGPGITYFQGKVKLEDILVEGNLKPDDVRIAYRESLKAIKIKQRKWADNLFRMADNDWNKYKNHRAISDLTRVFAKIYGIADQKEWMVEASIEQVMIDCQRCYTKVDSRASICATCNNILNPEKDKTFVLNGPERVGVKVA